MSAGAANLRCEMPNRADELERFADALGGIEQTQRRRVVRRTATFTTHGQVRIAVDPDGSVYVNGAPVMGPMPDDSPRGDAR